MSEQPDFEALRKARNEKHAKWVKRMESQGFKVAHCAHSDDACYCACGQGGPCEHDWTGPEFRSDDELLFSATCARCGMLAYSHSLRTGP